VGVTDLQPLRQHGPDTLTIASNEREAPATGRPLKRGFFFEALKRAYQSAKACNSGRDRSKKKPREGSHRGWRNWRNKPACMRLPRIRRKSGGSQQQRHILGKGPEAGPFLCNFDLLNYARRPSSGPSRLACTHACRRGGPSYPSGIRAWPPTYRVYQEALQPATGRNSRRGHKILGHNIHGDMHASQLCGGRQQRSRVLAVARYGIAPCPRTKTYLCLVIDEAISAPRTALLLPIESLQSRLSFSCASPPEATVA